MKRTILSGWNVDVKSHTIKAPKQGNGEMVDVPGWTFTFTEVMPATGDTIEFSFGEEARDFIVKGLTGGVVLPPGTMPIDRFRPE